MNTREEMAGLVAKWAIPPPGSRRTKARATKAEMAERGRVTRWLIETAGRALSRRGVAYRAESLLDLPKTEKAFRLIEEMTLTLRDDGEIPWRLIRDGRRSVIWNSRGEWESVDEFIESSLERALHGYDRNPWMDTDVQGQVWMEKEDLADALGETAEDLGLDVHPASGFTGAGFLRSAIEDAARDPRPLVIFQFTDFDSSGNRMRESFQRRVRTFAADLGVEIEEIVAVGLTAAQIAAHKIPTRPQKDSTHRRPEDGNLAAELDAVDALQPGLLGEWLTEAIEPYCPTTLREANKKHIESTEARLAGLTVKLDEEED